MTIDLLNKEYAIHDQLTFFDAILDEKADEGAEGEEKGEERKDTFPFIRINNQYASAVISIYGGQVLSFLPRTANQTNYHELKTNDLLFLSTKAFYHYGKAIKGGIPVCWPWFGNDPEGLGRSAHGFARNRMWAVRDTAMTEKGETQVSLGLVDSEDTRSIWPYAFNLTLKISVGKTLKLELITHNCGIETFTITQALHTYFFVGNISQTRVTGLDGIDYSDTTRRDWPVLKQHDDVRIDNEVDRIYTNVPAQVTLIDDSLERQIQIRSCGNNSLVIWNPWITICAQMADLENKDYLHFLCIETANAASDSINIKPGDHFCLSAEYKMI